MLKLKDLVLKHALETKPDGEWFTLKNGSKSRYYLDCRNLHLTPVGLTCVVNLFLKKLGELSLKSPYQAIGGPSLGADPIIGGLMYAIGFSNTNSTRGFLVRKESKEYGKGGQIVGPLRAGDNCVIFEDVVNSGLSTLLAIDAVEAFGAKVVQIYSVVDRLCGADEAFGKRGIPYESLLSIRDLGLE